MLVPTKRSVILCLDASPDLHTVQCTGLPARLMKMALTVLMVRTFQRKMREALTKNILLIWARKRKRGSEAKRDATTSLQVLVVRAA